MQPEVMGTTIMPEDIDLSDRLSNTFGTTEREDMAVALIDFAQTRGSWADFRLSDVIACYGRDVSLLELAEAEQQMMLEYNDDGTFSFSFTLISQAHRTHPM